MRRLWNFFQEKMNDFTVRKKLLIFYVFCVLLPLFVTDSVILTILLRGERRERALEMENIASAVQFELSYTFEEAMNMSKNIYANRMINEFLNQRSRVEYEKWQMQQRYYNGFAQKDNAANQSQDSGVTPPPFKGGNNEDI